MVAETKTRILLVDDQPANLAVLQAVLAGLGQELVAVPSGERALRALLEHEFAVVLMDVQMPTMSGFEAARLIREHPRLRTVPIIFLTAGDDAGFPLEDAYALGAVDYLTKPFNQTVLRAKVAVFIELYRKNAELARLERLRHTEALRSRDERIRLILDNVRDYAFIGTDVERRVTEWEGGAAAITGWSADEAIGQSADMLFLPEDRASGQPGAEAQRALANGRAEDRRWHLRRDGNRFFADGVMVALRDQDGSLRGFAKILRDATTERHAAERLEQSEQQLGESLERFSLLLDSAGEGIFGINPDGLCTFMNAAGAAKLGYRPAELVGQRIHERIHAHREDGVSYPESDCPILRAARAGQVLRADSDTFLRKDGSPMPVSYSVYPMVIGGRTAGVVLTFTDITPRRQVEAERDRLYREVRAANERMIDIFDRAPAFMCVLRGPGHVFEMVNERFLELTGRRELAGRPLREALPEVEGQGWFELLDEVLRTGQAREGANTRLLLRSGGARQGLEEHFVDYVLLALRNPDASISGVLVHGVDVTERRRAEEGIRRLAAVAEQSSDFIGIFSPDAGGIYLNPAGRTLAGLAPAADLAALRLIDFVAEEYRQFVRDEVLPALAGKSAKWEGELRFARHGGTATPVYFKGFAVRDADGANIGLAVITRDITRQKRAEDELRRIAADLSEADHRKSEFLATLAHELRNPLAPIRTGLDLLRLAPPGEPGNKTLVYDMMDRQLGHLVHLVDDLLDVARITRGKIELKKQKVDLRAIAATALEASAALVEGGGHKLEVELPDAPIELDADATRLVQVLSNLLNNAAKYTPAGGRVALRAWREDGQAVVAVSDTGVGIPPEALGSVFEMFTQVRRNLDRAQGGLGIGLSLVRRLVELHGGRVSVDSGGLGKGSTFTVRLPLRPARRGEATGPAGEPAGPAAPRPLRVLVVDDNVDAAQSLVTLLELLGHAVRVAHDGPQGFRLAQEFAPDLVFLDIGLPGMSGHDVARAIRGTWALRDVVLIALTGWGAAHDMTRSQDAGFDQHLTKPVSVEALEQTIAAAAEARQ